MDDDPTSEWTRAHEDLLRTDVAVGEPAEAAPAAVQPVVTVRTLSTSGTANAREDSGPEMLMCLSQSTQAEGRAVADTMVPPGGALPPGGEPVASPNAQVCLPAC